MIAVLYRVHGRGVDRRVHGGEGDRNSVSPQPGCAAWFFFARQSAHADIMAQLEPEQAPNEAAIAVPLG